MRLRYAKTGIMSLLSHLELIQFFTRAVRRARIPILFSHGFHPHPRFSFATALSVGVESWAEYFDMEIEAGLSAEQVRAALNGVLPRGIEILEAEEIPKKSESLSVIMDSVRYRVTLPGDASVNLSHKVDHFLGRDAYPFQREKKGKSVELDLRRELVELSCTTDSLEMEIRKGRPLEFVSAITGLPSESLGNCRIEKLSVTFRKIPENHEQMLAPAINCG
jgi:radical SAM-linked protein